MNHARNSLEKPSKPTPDKCPDWAQSLIEKMLAIEIPLGNIPDQNVDIDAVYRRVFGNDQDIAQFDRDHVDQMFSRLVRGLDQDGFSSEDIVTFINGRIGYPGGPPYCNQDEVKAALNAQT